MFKQILKNLITSNIVEKVCTHENRTKAEQKGKKMQPPMHVKHDNGPAFFSISINLILLEYSFYILVIKK